MPKVTKRPIKIEQWETSDWSSIGKALGVIFERRGKKKWDGHMAKAAAKAGMTPQRYYHACKVADPKLSTVERLAKGAGVKTSSLVAEAEKLGG